MATKERCGSSMPRTVVGMSAQVRAMAMPKPVRQPVVPQPRRRAMAEPWIRCAAYNVGASQAKDFTTPAKQATFDKKVIDCLSK